MNAEIFQYRKTPPCKDCTDRKHGCHAGCEKYCTWKQEYQEAKKVYDDQQEKVRNHDSFVIDSWSAARKRIYHKPRKKQ